MGLWVANPFSGSDPEWVQCVTSRTKVTYNLIYLRRFYRVVSLLSGIDRAIVMADESFKLRRLQALKSHLQAPSIRLVAQPTAAVGTFSTGSGTEFGYVRAGSRLTAEQKRFYEQNGYLVMPKLVPDDQLEIYRQRFVDICDGKVPKNNMTVMKDVSLRETGRNGEFVVNKVQDFVHDPVLFEYCRHPNVVQVVESFCGPNVMAMHTMLINKPPDAGTLSSRHPMHQDLYYFPFRPENLIVASWTAMEPVTRANGCLVVLPGTHKGHLLEHGYPEWEGKVNKMYHGIQNLDPKVLEGRVHLEMEKGDTVFFHPLLIHGSGANRTSGFRKAISCHYAASECDYVDVTGTVQESIAQEVVDLAKSRGFELDFRDVWSLRARIVSGERINM